jgi:hypothetical protein
MSGLQNQNQTLQNIKQLQDLEKDLYTKLEKSVAQSNSTSTTPEQTEIIKRINELSQMRINLFKSLNQMSSSIQHSVSSRRVDLVDQLTLIGVVEKELNNAKAHMNETATAQNNKMRMVEINTYYGKRYKAYTELMKLFIIICIPLLLLAILKKRELIPETIMNGISAVILLIGSFFFIRKLFDISWRDNMNFDEYQWINMPTGASGKTVYEYDKEQIEGTTSELENEAQTLGSSLGGCIGSECCSGTMIYDQKAMKCVDSPSPIKESFIASIFNTSTSANAYDVVKPFSLNSNSNFSYNYASL